jgi:hypothetical protein
VNARLALEILTLAVGAVAMMIALPRATRRRRVRQMPEQGLRPADLEALERLAVTGRTSAANVHSRLRPMLQEIAAVRLRRRGVDLERAPDDARTLLGEELWELVRPDRPLPADLHGKGISLEQLSEMVARLEAM